MNDSYFNPYVSGCSYCGAFGLVNLVGFCSPNCEKLFDEEFDYYSKALANDVLTNWDSLWEKTK